MKWLRNIAIAVLLLGLVFCMVTGLAGSGSSGSNSTPDLNAKVWDMGSYIRVRNNDSFTWTNVRLELNSGLVADGYTAKVGDIAPGGEVRIITSQFAKSNGERFNASRLMPMNFGIWCDEGYHYGEWR